MLLQKMDWSCYASGKPEYAWLIFPWEGDITLPSQSCKIFNCPSFQHAIFSMGFYIRHGLDTSQAVFTAILTFNRQVRLDLTQPVKQRALPCGCIVFCGRMKLVPVRT